MKLHLTKSLVAALVAGFGVVSQALAADITTEVGVTTNLNEHLSDNVTVVNGSQATFSESGTMTGTVTLASTGYSGALGGLTVNNKKSAVLGTLNVTGEAQVLAWDGASLEIGSIDLGSGNTLSINDSQRASGSVTVTCTSMSGTGTLYFAKGYTSAITNIAAGQTLELSGTYNNDTKNWTLEGSAAGAATLKLDSTTHHVLDGSTITLKGNTAITGADTNGVILDGTTLDVEGTDNEISSILAVRQSDATLNVKGESDVLMVSNNIIYNQYGSNGDTNSNGAVLTKSGAGALVLAEGVTVGENVNVSVEGGSLDLSNVSTLGAKALTLSNEATLVLGANFGESAISFTGALTFNVDLDGISTLADEAPYTTISLSGTTADAFVDGTTLFSGVSSTGWTDSQVTLDFGNGSTGLYNLTLSEGNVLATAVPTTGGDAVPEPTTATLSLLALAGLCARRRRK